MDKMNDEPKIDLPKDAAELRKLLAAAKDEQYEPARKEVTRVLTLLSERIKEMLANPGKFTSHTCMGIDNPKYGFTPSYDACQKFFYEELQRRLPPGFRAVLGVVSGMYEVCLIRWDEDKRVRGPIAGAGVGSNRYDDLR